MLTRPRRLAHHHLIRASTIAEIRTYETYGALNADRSNVILIPHFYSANSHAARKYKAGPLFFLGYGSSIDADLKKIKARTLLIQVRTDLLFPPAEAKAVVETLKRNGTSAHYGELDTPSGHIGGIIDMAKRGDGLEVS